MLGSLFFWICVIDRECEYKGVLEDEIYFFFFRKFLIIRKYYVWVYDI